MYLSLDFISINSKERNFIMTAEHVKQAFKNRGVTFTDWAKENGYELGAVYRVLNGQAKCHYGKAHEIAVKLGLKREAPVAPSDAPTATN
jgi:gp16 family phage-associated protein